MNVTPASINAQIAKGTFRPHTALTNMALSYYQNAANYFAKAIFPVCRVNLSADRYYIFNKGDLLRDNWKRKPELGKVMPAVLSETTGVYSCSVDQMIMGINQIRETDIRRRQGPSIARDPRQQKTKAIAEQANIHQDRLFADGFFRSGVWANEFVGTDNTVTTGNEFIKFSNGNSNPIKYIEKMKFAMHQQTGRMPNRLAIGTNVFTELCEHPAILERVIHGGTSANPAQVTKNALAELFGVEKLVVLMSVFNDAELGQEDNMQYIGDPNGMLLSYATDAPSVDEPSAGYIFTWDMLGDGQLLPILNYEGEGGTHAEYIEGLMAYDMRKTADDLAYYFSDVV